MINDPSLLFCEVLAGFCIAIPIGAFVLQTSCSLYDLLTGVSGTAAGEPNTDIIIRPEPDLAPPPDSAEYERIVTSPGVPRPSFERAVLIFFFAALVNTAGSFILFRIVRLVGQASVNSSFWPLTIVFISSPLGVLVLGGICNAMLPTSFGKGLLVSVLFHLLSILFAALLAAVAVLIVIVFGLRIPGFG